VKSYPELFLASLLVHHETVFARVWSPPAVADRLVSAKRTARASETRHSLCLSLSGLPVSASAPRLLRDLTSHSDSLGTQGGSTMTTNKHLIRSQ